MKIKGFVYTLLILIAGFISFIPFISTVLDENKGFTPYVFLPVAVFIILLLVYIVTPGKKEELSIKVTDTISDIKLNILNEIPTAIAIINKKGVIYDFNKMFASSFELKKNKKNLNISEVIKIDLKLLNKNGIVTVYFSRNVYRVYAVKNVTQNNSLTVLYFQNDTDYVGLQNTLQNAKPCIMLISIDNYSDVMKASKDSEKSRISSEIEQLLDQYIAYDRNVVILKSSNDTFTVLMEEYNLKNIVAGKFKILDEARLIKTSSNNNITLSIGVAFGGESLTESLDLAKLALDMALGRGGDQAAVKANGSYKFFGGVSKGVEKQSRTKTRAVANTLKDFIKRSEKVYIMGHSYSDLDSVGSACGMAGAVKALGKESYVVLRKKTTLANLLVEKMEDCEIPVRFIEPETALENLTKDTLLIIVDTHNKKILESAEVYEAAEKVVVIDHHRKIVDYIDNADIFYHEPFASSACELVTELIQYFEITPPLSPDYANALLSGIMTDTKNFVMQTGVRTFEAAAYLKKTGADTITVKGLFSDSISSFRLRSKIISEAEFFNGCAISIAGSSDICELRVISSQAADQLLNIKDVNASFVIYEMNDVVNISARSLGKVNVQVLMEKLGGGGHQTMAATQMREVTMEEARDMLKELITELENEKKGA